jgi:hypothetical protein
LVFPDNGLLGPDWFVVYQAALQQCATVQSTFGIFDFYYNETEQNSSYQTTPPIIYNYTNEVNAFRTLLGMNNLNYAAVYGPWIGVLPSQSISFSQVQNIYAGGVPISSLISLTSNANIISAITSLEQLVSDIGTINTRTAGIITTVEGTISPVIPGGPLLTLNPPPPPFTSLSAFYSYLQSLLSQSVLVPNSGIEYIFNFIYNIALEIQSYVATSGGLENAALTGYINNPSTNANPGLISSQFSPLFKKLVELEYLIVDTTGNPLSQSIGTFSFTLITTSASTAALVQITVGGTVVATNPSAYVPLGTLTTSQLITLLNSLTPVPNTGYTLQFSSLSAAVTITAPVGSAPTGSVDLVVLGNPTAATGGPFAGYVPYHKQLPTTLSTGPIDPTWGITFSDTTAATTPVFGITSAYANAQAVLTAANSTINQIIVQYGDILSQAQSMQSTQQTQLAIIFPVYAAIVNGINSTPIALPPSGAMAGIYAYVDNSLGVWKAPANVSIDGVVEPDWNFASTEYDDMNVDLNAGKSINAIRAFTGKGTLVWGARTLAGNDLNWRYISVRRFFIMVEQAVKDALGAYVFEPNDANTWAIVTAEVSNYLFTLYRAGALMGTTPAQAYSVQCGLGTTMTAQDILNGNMIVVIGMAVVRPAEFIILQFTQNVLPQGN